MTFSTRRLKLVASINDEKLDEATDGERPIRYVDIGSVGRGRLIEDPQTLRFADAPSRARRLVRPGDTIVSTVRTYLRAVWPVVGPTEDLVVSTGFAVVRPRDVDARFAGWALQSDAFVEEVVARSVGVSYPAINPSELGSVRMPVPHRDEQIRIADYLDDKTSRIEAVVAAKRAMAALISERHAAVVSRELFGRASRIRLSRLGVRATSGNRDHGSFVADGHGIPCIRGLNVRRGAITETNLFRISVESHAAQRATQLSEGDIVVVRSGVTAGYASMVPASLDGSNCVDLVVLSRSPRVCPRFLEYVVNSREVQDQVRRGGADGVLPHFNAVDASAIEVPNLPMGEQAAIARHLDVVTKRALATLNSLARQIELLQEHRRSMISAAVTGELGVA